MSRAALVLAVALLSGPVLAAPAGAADNTLLATGNWDDAAKWSDGVPTADDHVIITAGRDVTLVGPAVAGSLSLGAFSEISGPHTLTVGAGASTLFSNGVFKGGSTTVFAGGTVAWTGADVIDPGTLVRLQGTTTVNTTDQNVVSNSGTLQNEGQFDIAADAVFTSNGSGVFRNTATGTVTRSAGTGNISFTPDLENHGTIDVQTGTLSVGTDSLPASTGTFTVAAGARLAVPSLTLALAGTGSITGAGTVVVGTGTLITQPSTSLDVGVLSWTGGNVNLGGAATVGGITSSGAPAVRTGTGTLNVGSGPSTADDIVFQGGGTTIFAPGSAVAWNENDVTGAGTLVRLQGTTTASANNRVALDGVLQNEGVFGVLDGVRFFTNGSAVVRNAATGTMTLNVPTAIFDAKLENLGQLSVASGAVTANGGFTQTLGTTTVTGGALLGGTVGLQGGVVSGAGTLGGNVTNSGALLKPGASPGTMTIGGAYNQGAGGTLELEATGTAPGSDPGHDRLVVTGDATLGGTVRVLLGGGFTPLPADLFSVLTAAAVSGNFATVDAADIGGRAWVSSVIAGAPATVVLGLGPPPPVPSNSTAPSVTGPTSVGSALTCGTGTWTGDPTAFAIVWLRDGVPIAGASGATYNLTTADQGATIACRVIATNNGGDSAPAASAGVAIPAPPQPPAPTPAPTPAPAPAAAPAVAPKPIAITQIAALPPAKACVSRRRFPIRLRGVKANRIVRAQIKLNGRQVRNVTGRALGLPIDLRGLPKGRFTVEIVTTDAAGKRLVGRRTYRTCVPKHG